MEHDVDMNTCSKGCSEGMTQAGSYYTINEMPGYRINTQTAKSLRSIGMNGFMIQCTER